MSIKISDTKSIAFRAEDFANLSQRLAIQMHIWEKASLRFEECQKNMYNDNAIPPMVYKQEMNGMQIKIAETEVEIERIRAEWNALLLDSALTEDWA